MTNKSLKTWSTNETSESAASLFLQALESSFPPLTLLDLMTLHCLSIRQYGVNTAHTRAHRASYLPKQQLEAETSREADQWSTKGKGWQLELVDKGLKKD